MIFSSAAGIRFFWGGGRELRLKHLNETRQGPGRAKLQPPHLSKKRSAKSGTQPSVPDQTLLGPDQRSSEGTATGDGQHLQAKCAERRNTGGESRVFAAANASTNFTSSGLNLRPVSTPMTTRRQRTFQQLLLGFFQVSSQLKRCSVRGCTVRHGSPVVVKADLNVMSTAIWAPCWMGKPMARISIALSSQDCTEMFMSRSFTSRRTVVPASRHILANVLSVASVLFRRPERAHAAL